MVATCRLPSAFTSPDTLEATQRQQYLEELVAFLAQNQRLSSAHTFDTLREGFNKVWPEEWKHLSKSEHFDIEHLIDLVKDGVIQPNWPLSLKCFLENCIKLQLPRSFNCDDFTSGVFESQKSSNKSATGMSRKKLHEVDRFARVILDRIKQSGISDTATIVDVGAGQGYLTHRLSTEYPCIAVDFNSVQTVGSEKRGSNIQKKLLNDCGLSKVDLADASLDRKPVVHKTILINAKSLQKMLEELEEADVTGKTDFVLVGLHACGDLSGPAMLQTFENCKSVKMVAVVPCCYNLLTEPETPCDVCETHGFAMSKSIQALTQTHNLTLGYSSRNLAGQTLSNFDRSGIHSKLTGHYKRALFDALLAHFNIQTDLKTDDFNLADGKERKLRLGKLSSEAYDGGFVTYAVSALSRLGLEKRVTKSQIEEFMDLPKYKIALNLIVLVTCIKSMLSRVLESLLLMDRFMVLVEMNGVTGADNVDVEMLNLFDVDESPRNMVFLAHKRSE
ncbi:hypothetical protein BCR33DRAFT_848822 [Rhizoclosmatium globosum]|uniref:Methyltransferase domain-containing protein n=1 Tax=Rhizoclosmatium globosum TaxID=329046 RepID=A0A1Y2CIL4_9FUNG|nr:hypothetical protein BCR33DRAFT_848822 [Rhizoclosmatium globosum]|eukprot:ORY46747.1 hypothetical protein BCR33DRAFT_848822 [Rhizoclosmatium globosum]